MAIVKRELMLNTLENSTDIDYKPNGFTAHHDNHVSKSSSQERSAPSSDAGLSAPVSITQATPSTSSMYTATKIDAILPSPGHSAPRKYSCSIIHLLYNNII